MNERGATVQRAIYQHYRNKHYYEVIAVALDTSTHAKTVVYRALYPNADLEAEYGAFAYFTRPYDVFHSEVDYEGVRQPMFTFVGSMD
ncbi:DUF1653 domain-containing protein [Limibaculum sp. FT325]|uniref:DUF1653 domain-containing protein n=1 Tax=Thermohalobaculum sediminis TaxID=2939436 RepID=UPI0020C08BC4|nr:DUF1653 domain-containing protein [Limibaculum sediminis]MCL5777198.1 DUF1653 domain-containing protein [Limibaculum sediminis]